MKKLKNILGDYIEDFLIFLGLIMISTTTFYINYVIGFYVLGFILLIIGIIIAKASK